MQTNKISFKNDNNFEQFKPVSNDTQVSKTLPQQNNDSFETSDKKKILTYSAIGAGLFLTLLAIVKRKAISEFFSNLFRKKEMSEIPKTKPVEPAKPKIPETSIVEQSFIPKPNFTCGEENPAQFAKEKFEYMQRMTSYVSKNEASALEGLDMFKKYGEKIKYGKFGQDTLTDLTISISCLDEKMTDKVLSRYLNVYNKFATKKDEYFHDAANLSWLLEKHYSTPISKDTAIKYIEALKKTAYQGEQAHVCKLYLLDPEFGPAKNWSKEEFKEVTNAVTELKEILKDKPFKDK
jgi:hypothetical protein